MRVAPARKETHLLSLLYTTPKKIAVVKSPTVDVKLRLTLTYPIFRTWGTIYVIHFFYFSVYMFKPFLSCTLLKSTNILSTVNTADVSEQYICGRTPRLEPSLFLHSRSPIVLYERVIALACKTI